MRAVFWQVPEHILAERRRNGADRWDEVWDGVLHMGPTPSVDHQDLEWTLETWLRRHWARRTGGRVLHQVAVARPGLADWRHDYRAPDVVLISPERLSRLRQTHLEGGPDVAIEIRSPHDESWDKVPFYAAVGVREVWILDRDAPGCAVLACGPAGGVAAAPNADGFVHSVATGVDLRVDDAARFGIRMHAEPDTLAWFPVEAER